MKNLLLIGLMFFASNVSAKGFVDDNGVQFDIENALMVESIPNYVHILYIDGRDAYYQNDDGKLFGLVAKSTSRLTKIGNRWVNRYFQQYVKTCNLYCPKCCI